MKILARERQQFGGRIKEVEVPSDVAAKIPREWTFVSKLTGLPKELRDRYSMFYNTRGEDNE